MFTTATSSAVHVQYCTRQERYHTPTPWWLYESMCNMLTAAPSSAGHVCIILVKNVITPSHPPLMTIREHVQHIHNGSKFRGPCIILVKNVITPPHPLMTIREHVQNVHNGNKFRGPCTILYSSRTLSHPPTPWWPYESMCNMLTTAPSSVGHV